MTALRRFFSHPQNVVAGLIIGLFVFMALAAPWLAPPADSQSSTMFKSLGAGIDRTPHPPSDDALLGTVAQIPQLPRFGFVAGQDAAFQWDVYYTVIWGARSALRFGLVTTGLTALLGVFIGAVSGYIGGWVNGVLMRLTDAFLAFPVIAAVWVFDRLWYGRIYNPWADVYGFVFTPWEKLLLRLELDPVTLAVVLFSWMAYARLINTSVVQLKGRVFVTAARASGARAGRIIWRHLLPNALSPIVVMMARDVGGLVILASAFTFIGIGGNVAWGIILVASKDYIIGIGGNPLIYWWTFVPVSLALILFGMGWNLLGDGLNAYLNPRSRGARWRRRR
jgi:peptide/nickel transport system permease protein